MLCPLAGLSSSEQSKIMEVVREMEAARFYYHRLLKESERGSFGDDDLDAAKVCIVHMKTVNVHLIVVIRNNSQS